MPGFVFGGVRPGPALPMRSARQGPVPLERKNTLRVWSRKPVPARQHTHTAVPMLQGAHTLRMPMREAVTPAKAARQSIESMCRPGEIAKRLVAGDLRAFGEVSGKPFIGHARLDVAGRCAGG